MMRRDWKLFLDQVTDMEDALVRMVELSREAGEHDLVVAASDAADHLLVLASVMVRRGDQVPAPEVTGW
ncbi:hypothetical protein ASF33_14750 [Methylobacterium sp. Leaf92]|nr:hypothetical protein ASF33_14750 [Methylobacterium sp. Leaf92]